MTGRALHVRHSPFVVPLLRYRPHPGQRLLVDGAQARVAVDAFEALQHCEHLCLLAERGDRAVGQALLGSGEEEALLVDLTFGQDVPGLAGRGFELAEHDGVEAVLKEGLQGIAEERGVFV